MVGAVTLPLRLLVRAWGFRLGRRLLTLLVAAVALAGAYTAWIRDLPIFRVSDVTVTGVKAGEAKHIRNALAMAARDMTTLNLSTDRLLEAVRAYPTVKDVEAKASFPTGIAIRVIEHVPAAVIRAEGRTVAVAADGTILTGMSVADRRLPRLPLTRLPSGRALASGSGLDEARILGAAPPALRSGLERIYRSRRGQTVKTRSGVQLYFGDTSRLGLKWKAATAVLSDAQARGLTYIDLRIPNRPAVGGLPAEKAATEEPGVGPGGTAPAQPADPAPPAPEGAAEPQPAPSQPQQAAPGAATGGAGAGGAVAPEGASPQANGGTGANPQVQG